MTDKFDYGPIISKVTYPVLNGDTVINLYERLTSVLPWFVLSSIRLLETLDFNQVSLCQKQEPNIFKKEKHVKEKDKDNPTTWKSILTQGPAISIITPVKGHGLSRGPGWTENTDSNFR